MNRQKKSDQKQTKQSKTSQSQQGQTKKRANQDNTPQNQHRQTKKTLTSTTEDQTLTSSQVSTEDNRSTEDNTSTQPPTSSQGSEDDTLRSPFQSKPVLIKNINIAGLQSLQERYKDLRLPSSYKNDTEQEQEPLERHMQGPFNLVVDDTLTADKDPLIGMCLRRF